MHRRVSQKSYAIIKQSCLPGQPASRGWAWHGRAEVHTCVLPSSVAALILARSCASTVNFSSVDQSTSTMAVLSRRALLLSALLCGVLCSSSAFTVRSGADVSQLLSSERHQQKCPGLSNRSSPTNVFMAGKGVALSVASGGAAASSDNGPSRLEKLKAFTSKNFFLLGMMVAVALARLFPHVSQVVCFFRSPSSTAPNTRLIPLSEP